MSDSSNVISAILFASNSAERESINATIQKQAPYLNLLEECDCPTKTLACIAECKPDVLFLLSTPSDGNREVQFLVEALLKTDFMPHMIIANSAISKSFFPSHQQIYQQISNSSNTVQTHCFVSAVNKKYHQLEIESIAYVRSDGDTAIIHFLSGESKTVVHSLLQLEKILPSFLRIGRSYLINPRNVKLLNGISRTCDFGNSITIELNRKQLFFLKGYFRISDFS